MRDTLTRSLIFLSIIFFNACFFESASDSTRSRYTITIRDESNTATLQELEEGVADTIVYLGDTSVYQFVKWQKESGVGTASFSDSTQATTVITVTGGEVVIRAQVFNRDSLVLRALLDSNGLSAVPVDSLLLGWSVKKRIESVTFLDKPISNLQGISALTELKSLYVQFANMSEIPVELAQLKKLVTVNFHGNKITAIPEFFITLDNIGIVYLDENNITALPENIFSMRGLKLLSLEDNNILQLPEMPSESILQTLDVTNNSISSIPASFITPHLTSLFIDGNRVCTPSVEMTQFLTTVAQEWATEQECN